jgi:alcohol dehydrogenase class IV
VVELSGFIEPLKSFELHMPSRVLFGLGIVEKIGAEAKMMKAQNVLIVTDLGVLKAGVASKVQESLLSEGIKTEVWDQVETEPSLSCIEKLLVHIAQGGFDLLIGVGGGSCMDAAKSAAVLARNEGLPEDYFAGGKKAFTNPPLPCITVPTTAGTGAEITWDAVIKDRTGIKAVFEHPFVMPTLTIVDPVMSASMPPKLTASSGIDALAHAIESSLTRFTNPITLALALQSIRLISSNLRTVVYQGNNIEARYNMALATLTEAFSEMNAGDIEAHGFGHLIGSIYKIPHGIACGIALPYAMEFNVVVSADRLALIAEAMGEDILGLPAREAAYKAVYAVKRIIEDVGLPTTLREVGVKREELPRLAEQAVTIPWIKVMFSYAVREMNKELAMKLLEDMWEGKLGCSDLYASSRNHACDK